MKTVLFACVRDVGRSQMAAAFFNYEADPTKARGVSAGIEPADRVAPIVVEAMREIGIDVSANTPSPLTAKLSATANYLVTMGCAAICPLIPELRREVMSREEWEVEDPIGQSLDRVRTIRDEIRDAVHQLVAKRAWGRPIA